MTHFHSEKCYAIGPGDTEVLICGQPTPDQPPVSAQDWRAALPSHCPHHDRDGLICACCTQQAIEQQAARIATLEQERDAAMKVLDPNMPESGLVDACRQVKQFAISAADNSEKYEARSTEQAEEMARLKAERDEEIVGQLEELKAERTRTLQQVREIVEARKRCAEQSSTESNKGYPRLLDELLAKLAALEEQPLSVLYRMIAGVAALTYFAVVFGGVELPPRVYAGCAVLALSIASNLKASAIESMRQEQP